MNMPEDVYKSGRADSDCFAVIHGRTKEELEKKRKAYFADYPTPGYNTQVVKIDKTNGIHRMRIERWHSCD